MNVITEQKRADLAHYIQHELDDDPAVMGIVVIGSVAKGTARADSDIDAFIFLDPFDLYAVPAEAKWDPTTNSYHSIMDHVENGIQLDFKRVSWKTWSDPEYLWPESICAELSEGWVAFDRFGQVQPLINAKTDYSDPVRQQKLDDAINHLSWLLSEANTGRPYDTLGSTAAHYRLHSAFDYLVQALFAFNRRWRTLRSRELTDLISLPWLPTRFKHDLFVAMNASAADKNSYEHRVSILKRFFDELVAKCQQDQIYGDNPLDEAFIRQHEEPGRGWNMVDWEQKHTKRRDLRRK